MISAKDKLLFLSEGSISKKTGECVDNKKKVVVIPDQVYEPVAEPVIETYNEPVAEPVIETYNEPVPEPIIETYNEPIGSAKKPTRPANDAQKVSILIKKPANV